MTLTKEINAIVERAVRDIKAAAILPNGAVISWDSDMELPREMLQRGSGYQRAIVEAMRPLTDLRERLRAFLRENPGLRTEQITAGVRSDPRKVEAVKRALQDLRQRGLVRMRGVKRRATWWVR